MRGLIKATNAASSYQARIDYERLRALAALNGLLGYMRTIPEGWGWKRIDCAAQGAVKRILKARPDLEKELAEIYPGFSLEVKL